jgi:hypothetical protein
MAVTKSSRSDLSYKTQVLREFNCFSPYLTWVPGFCRIRAVTRVHIVGLDDTVSRLRFTHVVVVILA